MFNDCLTQHVLVLIPFHSLIPFQSLLYYYYYYQFLTQHCGIELSAVVEEFYICPVQYVSHWY